MGDSIPKISIIFPSYNGEKFLKRNFDSIKNLLDSNNLEIVIIDNNSNDSTKEIIKSYFDVLNIKLIELDRNIGFSKACNLGASNATGEFLFITNQDMIFTPDFFNHLLKLYKRYRTNEDIVISPAIVFEDDGIHYFGAKIHLLGFSYTPSVGRELPSKKIVKKTQRFSGGSLFLKRTLFIEMKGFEEVLFMYYEDTDLSLRFLRKGIKIYTTNFPYIIHQKHEWVFTDNRYYLLERNRYIFLFKNISNVKKLLPLIIISEFILLFQAILIKKFKLRIRVYYELLTKTKMIKQLRVGSKKKIPLISYQKLNRILDPVLLYQYQNSKLFKKALNIFNNLIKNF